jgi:hypothetical protein
LRIRKIKNLILDEKGVVYGGGSGFMEDPFPDTQPISIVKQSDGSYLCTVTELPEGYEEDLETSPLQYVINYFIIYPKGIVGENLYGADKEYLRDHVYINYLQIDGGIMDVIYCLEKNE